MHALADLGQSGWTYLWTPVLTWSAAMLVLLVILKLIPKQYPQIHLDVRIAGLLALVLGVLISFVSSLWPDALPPVVSLPGLLSFSPEITPVGTVSTAQSTQFSWLYGIGVMTIGALGLTAFGILRLVADYVRLSLLLKRARPGDPSHLSLDSSPLFQETVPITVLVSDDTTTAFSTGLFTRQIVIPDSLADQDCSIVLLHEYNHLINGDVVRAGLSHVCRALFFFHPLVHFLHKRSLLLTEIICDRRTLQLENIKPRQYANVLLRNAPMTLNQAPILAFAHSPSQLRQRVVAMKNHVSLPLSSSILKFIGFIVLFMVSVVVGCSDTELAPTQVDIDPNMRELVMAIPAAPLTEKPFVIVEQMPVLVGGLEGIQRSIKYPEIAKKAGVQGRVFLQFVVDVDGNVIDPVVTRGIGAGCDEAAVQALEQAHFIPGVQRNLRVPVKMSIPVTFRLDGPLAAKIPPGRLEIPDSNLPEVRPEDIRIFDSFADVDFDYVLVLHKNSIEGPDVSAEDFRRVAAENRGYAIVRGGERNRDIVDPRISKLASEPGALFVIRKK